MTDWAKFRDLFPVTGSWAFLDHAGVAPLPVPAVAAFEEYARSLSRHGVAAVGDWVRRIAEVRSTAASLINAPSPEDVFFIPNTTWGIGAVAEGFPWQPGDNVVSPAEEYPANVYAWMNLADRGVELRRVPSRGNRILIDDLRAAMDSRTRMLAVSFVEYASGFRNDLAALGQLCHERNLFFFVDAIQGLGAIPLDVQAMGIHALAADSHKWLLGPEGAGIGYIHRDWAGRMRAVGVGVFSMNQLDFNRVEYDVKPHAGKWEGGAYNMAGLAAMGASMNLLRSVGVNAIWERIQTLTDYVCERARQSGFEVFSSRSAADRSGIVSLSHPTNDAVTLMKTARSGGVIVNARHGRLRVSPHAYNTNDDIDRLFAVLSG